MKQGVSRHAIILALCLGSIGRSILAQEQTTNNWIKPTSGAWEEQTAWSLGQLPGAGQAIQLSNEGWKAVGIGPNTSQNYPQTLNVSSITIASPTNSFNELLLNYAGLETSLQTYWLTIC